MVLRLKRLLGKTRRPIVLNGELLKYEGSVILASLKKYKVMLELSGREVEYDVDDFETLVDGKIAKFNEKYGSIVGDISDEDTTAGVDQFSGAIVVNTPVFRIPIEEHMHDVDAQFMPGVAEKVTAFLNEYTANYMDVYIYLLNRRVASTHAPIMTRGHLVEGLFQPLIVDTALIKSPFRFGPNKWLSDLFESDTVWLEHSGDHVRGVTVSCVAMCDIAKQFGVVPVKQLDRKHWMFMCELVLVSAVNKEDGVRLQRKYGAMFNKILDSQGSVELLAAMLNYANKTRKAIKVV